MIRRGNRRAPDSDDWFDDAEPTAPRPAPASEREAAVQDAPATTDDWLAGEAVSEQPARHRSLDKVGFAGAALLVALFAGLAIAGVFTSTHHRPPTPATVSKTTTPTTTASTTAARSAVTPPTSTLKPGDTGAQVTNLQQTLAALGYATGAADGNYGPATQSAVARFQRASGLTADGIFGSQTLSALRRVAG